MRPMTWAIVLAACGACHAEARAPASRSSVATPADQVRMLPAPDYQLPIGTPHPFWLGLGSAHDGRWLVGCQARTDTDGKPGIEVSRGPDGFRLVDEVLIPASCNAELVGVRINPLRIFAACARHPDFSMIELSMAPSFTADTARWCSSAIADDATSCAI